MRSGGRRAALGHRPIFDTRTRLGATSLPIGPSPFFRRTRSSARVPRTRFPLSTDWFEQDATSQAAAIARGEVDPRALVAAARERLEQLDPKLGILSVLSGGSDAEIEFALATHGPFRGVPFLMKDVGARQAGRPYYAGNRALREADHRADADTPLGARFRALGLVTLGNSRSPEFGLQSNTWPLVQGPTRNPWDTSRAAGGSSGGACAAVAAGLVPVAHASDGAGSIRIPAAWCGLVGLKPSRDRIDWRHRGKQRPDVEFVVARSLRDTARFLDLLRPAACRAADAAPYSSVLAAAEAVSAASAGGSTRPRGAVRAGRRAASPARRLRIAFWTRSPDGSAVHPDCRRAVEAAAARLERLGHAVVEAAPPGFSDRAEYADRSLHGAVLGLRDYRDCLDDLAARIGRPVGPEDVEPFLWQLAHLGGADEIDPEALVRSAEWVAGWERRTLAWFDDYDVLVTPTVGCPAPFLDDLDPRVHEPLDLLAKMVPHMAFTEIWNATGQPALSLPLAQTAAEGLPIGVQLVGAPGREDRLFALGAELMPSGIGLPQTPPAHG
ncbi:MAG: amidase [Myxococcota bacterium]